MKARKERMETRGEWVKRQQIMKTKKKKEEIQEPQKKKEGR